jgi:hypothetical protein
LETTIKKIQQESAKEMAILKEQMKKQGINLEQMDIPWTELIKVYCFMVKGIVS